MRSTTEYQLFSLREENEHLKRELERLSQQAHTDELTLLPNRRALDKMFPLLLEESRNQNHPLSTVFWDIDDFKRINDSLGHQCGDEMLKFFGHLLNSLLPPQGYLSRVGGDEFFMILPQFTGSQTRELVERIQTHLLLANRGLCMPFTVTASVGIACLCEALNTTQALYHAADKAMYRDKLAL